MVTYPRRSYCLITVGWIVVFATLQSACWLDQETLRRPHAHSDIWDEVKTMQGTSLQGLNATDALARPEGGSSWLQGSRFTGRLADGRSVEVTEFAGPLVHVQLRAAPREDDEMGESQPITLLATEFVGTTWIETRCDESECTQLMFRIADVRQDRSQNTMPDFSSNDDVWQYLVEYMSLDDRVPSWRNVCDSDELGLFVSAQWLPNGEVRTAGYTFSCQRGVIDKCGRQLGYKWWKTLDAPGYNAFEPIDLQPLHTACTRAARAEYCGDFVSYTENGIAVDIFDTYGLNRYEAIEGFALESTWTEYRAARINHARVAGLTPPSCTQPTDPQEDYEGFWPTNPTTHPVLIHVQSDPNLATRR